MIAVRKCKVCGISFDIDVGSIATVCYQCAKRGNAGTPRGYIRDDIDAKKWRRGKRGAGMDDDCDEEIIIQVSAEEEARFELLQLSSQTKQSETEQGVYSSADATKPGNTKVGKATSAMPTVSCKRSAIDLTHSDRKMPKVSG